MKRILSTLLLSLTALATFATPFSITSSISLNVARAQDATPATQEQISFLPEDQQASATAASQNLAASQKKASDSATGGCGFDVICTVAKWFIGSIGQLIISILSWMQAVAGTVLNFSINVGIVHFGTHVNNIGVIDDVWATFRDLANIVFIFTLLLIAIGTILQLDEFGYKKLLMSVILLAVFVNFSLFITKFIIDVSNLTATQFANAIQVGTPAGNGTGAVTQDASRYGVGNAFAKALSLQALFQTVKDNEVTTPWSLLGIILLSSIFIIISSIVFIVAAVILIARFVTLIFLMVLSPLAFAAMVLPWTEDMSEKWWHTLFNNAIYAPVFMLLMWFTARVVTSDSFRIALLAGPKNQAADVGTAWQSLVSAGTTAPDSIGVVFYFLVVIGSLLGSVWIAKTLSMSGAELGMKLGSAAAFAVPALAARQTVGRLGGAVSRSSLVKNWAAGRDSGGNEARGVSGFLTKNIGKGVALSSRRASNATFDARNAGISGLGNVSEGFEGLGLHVGEGGHSTYEKGVKDRAASQKAFLDSLKPGEEEREDIRQKTKAEFAPQRNAAEESLVARKKLENEEKGKVEDAAQKLKKAQDGVSGLELKLEEMRAKGEEKTPAYNVAAVQLATAKQETLVLGKNYESVTSSLKKASASVAEAEKALEELGKKESGAAGRLANARVASAATSMRDEVFGIKVPTLVKSRGSRIAAIKALEDQGKDASTKAVETIVAAMGTKS